MANPTLVDVPGFLLQAGEKRRAGGKAVVTLILGSEDSALRLWSGEASQSSGLCWQPLSQCKSSEGAAFTLQRRSQPDRFQGFPGTAASVGGQDRADPGRLPPAALCSGRAGGWCSVTDDLSIGKRCKCPARELCLPRRWLNSQSSARPKPIGFIYTGGIVQLVTPKSRHEEKGFKDVETVVF